MELNPHEQAASVIIPLIIARIREKSQRYTISLAGESGCGKTETSKALINELRSRHGVSSIVLRAGPIFFLAPAANDAMRKKNPKWLGPHQEVNMKLIDETFEKCN